MRRTLQVASLTLIVLGGLTLAANETVLAEPHRAFVTEYGTPAPGTPEGIRRVANPDFIEYQKRRLAVRIGTICLVGTGVVLMVISARWSGR